MRTVAFRCRCGRDITYSLPAGISAWPMCTGCGQFCQNCSCPQMPHTLADVDSDGFTPPDGSVDHPPHYGGDTPFEAIKVIEAWGLGFALGNAVKYISRAGKKVGTSELEDLRKARWYLDREIATREATR